MIVELYNCMDWSMSIANLWIHRWQNKWSSCVFSFWNCIPMLLNSYVRIFRPNSMKVTKPYETDINVMLLDCFFFIFSFHFIFYLFISCMFHLDAGKIVWLHSMNVESSIQNQISHSHSLCGSSCVYRPLLFESPFA